MSTAANSEHAPAAGTGRVKQKARTRRLLIETAVKLIAAGGRPSVSVVADAAMVSRRTAYRYFPTQEKLHAEAALEGLRPAMEAPIQGASPGGNPADVGARLAALVENMQRLAVKNEALLRTMIHQTVLEQPAAGATRRGSRRLDWIDSALKPLKVRLGGAAYDRLRAALALCAGIESLLVLRDICGLSAADATQISQWMAQVLLNQSLSESDAARRKRAGRGRLTKRSRKPS